jgi:phosphatidylglycerol:prolipoprotein diacylglycerol transferase
VHPILFHLGHTGVPTFGVCMALALLAALAVSVACAKRAGLNAEKVWNLDLIAILTALFAGRLLMILMHPRWFGSHPFWLLGLLTLPDVWFALGGAVAGLMAAMLYALAEGLPMLRTADVVAPAVAIAFCVNRVGAFYGGSAWGTPTHLPWGVTYRSPVAYLWYRVPLGVALHPVQLYDAAVSLVLFGLLVWMGRRGVRRTGEIGGAWLFCYGVTRFFLEFLRGDPGREPLFGGALTVAQLLSMMAVIAGSVLWLRRQPTSLEHSAPASSAPRNPGRL